VAWWPFNGNANDESGNGFNGTVNGSTPTLDRFGNPNSAYQFVSGNRIISTAILPLGNSPRSISIWFKTNSLSYNQTTGYDANVLFCYGSGGLGNLMSLETQGGGLVVNQYGPALYDFGYFVSDNQWHHAVYTFDGTFHTLFLDGIIIDSDTYVINTTDTQLVFGTRPTEPNSHNYNGILDDVGVWNRALTSCEVADLYNAQVGSLNSSSTISQSACSSYTWNGSTYTQSGQ
jgi:hypothetical protein